MIQVAYNTKMWALVTKLTGFLMWSYDMPLIVLTSGQWLFSDLAPDFLTSQTTYNAVHMRLSYIKFKLKLLQSTCLWSAVLSLTGIDLWVTLTDDWIQMKLKIFFDL